MWLLSSLLIGFDLQARFPTWLLTYPLASGGIKARQLRTRTPIVLSGPNDQPNADNAAVDQIGKRHIGDLRPTRREAEFRASIMAARFERASVSEFLRLPALPISLHHFGGTVFRVGRVPVPLGSENLPAKN